MTIDEAIKTLEAFHDQAACTFDATSANAFQLGIEALKCVKEIRHHPFPESILQLPGETENV